MSVSIFRAKRADAEAHWAASRASDSGETVDWEKVEADHPFQSAGFGTGQWYEVILPALQAAFGREIYPDFENPVEPEVIKAGFAHLRETGKVEVDGLNNYPDGQESVGLTVLAEALDFFWNAAEAGEVVYK